MVNRANAINGRNVDRHPFSDQGSNLGIYLKGTSVIAGRAEQAGIIDTAEGKMTFQPGDYIVTDNPPTHVWAVRQQVFETTYNLDRMLQPGQFPTSEPSIPYTQPVSVPPSNVAEIKNAEVEQELDNLPHDPGTGVPEAMLPEARPAKRTIADSKSLGLDR